MRQHRMRDYSSMSGEIEASREGRHLGCVMEFFQLPKLTSSELHRLLKDPIKMRPVDCVGLPSREEPLSRRHDKFGFGAQARTDGVTAWVDGPTSGHARRYAISSIWR